MNARHVARGIALALGLASACVPALAGAATPSDVRKAPDGTLQYPFPGRAPQLACAPLFVCTIALRGGETVTGLATGDSARWIIATSASGPGGSVPLVLVKPKETGLHTNLVIATTSHVYYVDLISSTTWSNQKVGFYYPSDEAAARAAQAQQAAEDGARAAQEARDAAPPQSVDAAYRIGGAALILPQRAYNDGAHTYVEYAKLPADLPVVVAVAPDGASQVVNYRLAGNTFVVDGVPPGLDLILNAGTGKHGSGQRLVQIRHI